jgi:hypothetical protein
LYKVLSATSPFCRVPLSPPYIKKLAAGARETRHTLFIVEDETFLQRALGEMYRDLLWPNDKVQKITINGSSIKIELMDGSKRDGTQKEKEISGNEPDIDLFLANYPELMNYPKKIILLSNTKDTMHYVEIYRKDIFLISMDMNFFDTPEATGPTRQGDKLAAHINGYPGNVIPIIHVTSHPAVEIFPGGHAGLWIQKTATPKKIEAVIREMESPSIHVRMRTLFEKRPLLEVDSISPPPKRLCMLRQPKGEAMAPPWFLSAMVGSGAGGFRPSSPKSPPPHPSSSPALEGVPA